MQNLYKLLLTSLLSAFSLFAQETEQGFLNIANVAPTDKPCKITIMGKDLVPGGLKGVDSTGWFIVPAGEHAMTLQIEGYQPASGTITVKPNLSNLYVVFLQQLEKKVDKDGKEIPPEVRIKRCAALKDAGSHYLKAMSLCPGEERFNVGPHVLDLKLYGMEEVTGWNGGAFTVKLGNKNIGSCSGSQEKGSYMLLFGTDHKGKYCSLLVRNEKQELPPWMKQKNK